METDREYTGQEKKGSFTVNGALAEMFFDHDMPHYFWRCPFTTNDPFFSCPVYSRSVSIAHNSLRFTMKNQPLNTAPQSTWCR